MTLTQGISCLVRDMFSFSKKLANHIGAIKDFICHYNSMWVAACMHSTIFGFTLSLTPISEHYYYESTGQLRSSGMHSL